LRDVHTMKIPRNPRPSPGFLAPWEVVSLRVTPRKPRKRQAARAFPPAPAKPAQELRRERVKQMKW